MKAKPARLSSARAEVARHRPSLAEAFRCFGQCEDRPYLVAQERDRDHQQHQRCADHPQQEYVGVRGVSLTAADEDTQHLVFKLDAHLDDVGVADRVEPEGAIDLAGDFLRQYLVEDREEGLGTGRGQGLRRQQIHLELHPVLRDADDVGVIGFVGIGFQKVDDGGDVARNGL
jgi:hypothetical protein